MSIRSHMLMSFAVVWLHFYRHNKSHLGQGWIDPQKKGNPNVSSYSTYLVLVLVRQEDTLGHVVGDESIPAQRGHVGAHDRQHLRDELLHEPAHTSHLQHGQHMNHIDNERL